MVTGERSTAVGVFERRADAERALSELRQAGFGEDELGIVAPRGDAAADVDLEKYPRDPTELGQETGTRAEEQAVSGAVTGGAIGGVIGAAAALLIPGIGPVLAGGILAAALSGAATGAAVGGLVGAFSGLDVPEEEAHSYEREFRAGRTIVTARARGRYQEAVAILRRSGARDLDTPRTQTEGRPIL